MSILKLKKVNAIPNPTEPSTLYFVTLANNKLGFYLTDKNNLVNYSSFSQSDIETIAFNLLGPKYKFIVGDPSTGVPVVQSGQIAIYTRQISTNGSSVTIYLTDDGTATGNAIFNNLLNCDISLAVVLNTTSDSLSPWAHLKIIDNNNKFITVQIKQSHTGSILLGGNYQGNNNNTSAVVLKVTISGILN